MGWRICCTCELHAEESLIRCYRLFSGTRRRATRRMGSAGRGGARGGPFRFYRGCGLTASRALYGRPSSWTRGRDLLPAFLILTPMQDARDGVVEPRSASHILHPAGAAARYTTTTSLRAPASASASVQHRGVATNGIPSRVGQHASPVLASHQDLTALHLL